jgi:hypothetical protein
MRSYKFVRQLKNALSKRIALIQQIPLELADRLVSTVLPDSNIYFFQSDFGRYNRSMELEEIRRFVSYVLQSPSYSLSMKTGAEV